MYNIGNLGTFRRMVMKENSGKQLAKKMLIALVCGLIAGFGCIIFREHLNSRIISYFKILQQKVQQVRLVFSI